MTNWHVKCETCQQNDAVGVAAVPGIPYSAAYCDDCLRANAHPWWVLIANQTMIDEPFETTADWWQTLVHATCKTHNMMVSDWNHDNVQVACPVCDAPGADFHD